MPIRAVAYVSEAVQPWSREGIDAMVERAASFNVQAGVTGVLFFDGVRFLQYFEGPEDGTSAVYHRIQGSSYHHGLIELSRGPVGRRVLPYWSMRWLLADPLHLRTMIQADWTGFVRLGLQAGKPTTAMGHLHHYVEPYIGGEVA